MLLHIALSLYIQYVSLEEVLMVYASFAEKRNSMIVIIKITVLEYKVKHCKTVFFSLKTKKKQTTDEDGQCDLPTARLLDEVGHVLGIPRQTAHSLDLCNNRDGRGARMATVARSVLAISQTCAH